MPKLTRSTSLKIGGRRSEASPSDVGASVATTICHASTVSSHTAPISVVGRAGAAASSGGRAGSFEDDFVKRIRGNDDILFSHTVETLGTSPTSKIREIYDNSMTPKRPALRTNYPGPARTLVFDSPAPKTPSDEPDDENGTVTSRVSKVLRRRMNCPSQQINISSSTTEYSSRATGMFGLLGYGYHADKHVDGWSDSDDDPEELMPGEHPRCCNCATVLPPPPISEIYQCRDGRRQWFCASCPSPRKSMKSSSRAS